MLVPLLTTGAGMAQIYRGHAKPRLFLKKIKIMERTKHSLVLLVALTLSLFTTLNISLSLGQSAADSENKLPPGKWSFSALPYIGSDYESRPVLVFSVTTDARKGAAVTTIGIQNRSSKTVTAVRFGWRLIEEGNSDSILSEGQTAMLKLQHPLPIASSRLVRWPVVSFAKIHKSFLNRGVLNGDFRIQVFVKEVLYEDGSTWAKSETPQVELAKEVNRLSHTSTIPQGCPKQYCTMDSSGLFQTCQASSSNTSCSNNADGTKCTNTICGTGGGGGDTKPTGDSDPFYYDDPWPIPDYPAKY